MWLSLFPLKLGASIGADAAAGGTGMGVCVCTQGGGWLCRITANQIKQAYWSRPGTGKKNQWAQQSIYWALAPWSADQPVCVSLFHYIHGVQNLGAHYTCGV